MNNNTQNNWNFLNTWSISNVPDSVLSPIPPWDNLTSFISSAKKVFSKNRDEVIKMLRKSDKLLKHVDGDPVNYDWKNFRPLRLSRTGRTGSVF
ncbi:hypothetical protein ACFL20_12940 [Spirochaetota bacterium]